MGPTTAYLTHTIIECIAYAVAWYVYRRQSGNDDVYTPSQRWLLVIAGAVGAFVGAHILGALDVMMLAPSRPLLALLMERTIVGGLLGGTLATEVMKYLKGWYRSSGDRLVAPLVAAISIGRIGCQITAQYDGTMGMPSNAPWALDIGDGIPRHPVSLYEILVVVILYVLIRVYRANGHRADGWAFRMFMTGYLLWRLFAEWLKPVAQPFEFGGIALSFIQVSCVLGIIYFIAVAPKLAEFQQRRAQSIASRRSDIG
ncbi:MAG TPA: diacylglyceryl transferase [Bacteroidetes bacterium]|nr:diacylglyceryl transferase [Bacteroidota bacterium]HRK04832.1 prolipoprotein diacylglyceryl transferase [Chlorobiota bacterium]